MPFKKSLRNKYYGPTEITEERLSNLTDESMVKRRQYMKEAAKKGFTPEVRKKRAELDKFDTMKESAYDIFKGSL